MVFGTWGDLINKLAFFFVDFLLCDFVINLTNFCYFFIQSNLLFVDAFELQLMRGFHGQARSKVCLWVLFGSFFPCSPTSPD